MSVRVYFARLWAALLGRCPTPRLTPAEPPSPDRSQRCSRSVCRNGADKRCAAGQCAECCAIWCKTAGINPCHRHYYALAARIESERRAQASRTWKGEN